MGGAMLRYLSVAIVLLLSGCSTPTLHLPGSTQKIRQLPLPTVDRGYRHLKTRVITSNEEYQAFLHAVEKQEGWERKVAFGMKVAKAKVDFSHEHLLIYRHTVRKGERLLQIKQHSVQEHNATVILEAAKTAVPAQTAQAFFYAVDQKIKRVIFKSPTSRVTVKNSKNSTVAPQECIAWFDGCNHCIRTASGRSLCTKRHCKQKGKFRCVKWQ